MNMKMMISQVIALVILTCAFWLMNMEKKIPTIIKRLRTTLWCIVLATVTFMVLIYFF